VQSELARRGYYQGAIDGVIGSGSREAIRAFQAAQGLPVTGRIDLKLLNALGIEYKTG
jgi:peptidoglycan hydrolase-like protein with peptidoglycan-binding domain